MQPMDVEQVHDVPELYMNDVYDPRPQDRVDDEPGSQFQEDSGESSFLKNFCNPQTLGDNTRKLIPQVRVLH